MPPTDQERDEAAASPAEPQESGPLREAPRPEPERAAAPPRPRESERAATAPPRPRETEPPRFDQYPDPAAELRDALREDDPSMPESVRNRVEAWVPELVKKAFAAGMGAVFTTEEGIRRITKEMPLPKDVAGYLVNTASTTKDEFFRIVAGEVRQFLQTVNLSEEIAKMLTTLSFEVKTEIRFIPNDQKYGGVEPDVKANVRLKRNEAAAPRRRVFRRKRRSGDSGGGDGGEQG